MAAKGGNFASTGFLVSQRFSTACNFTVKTERKTSESVCSFSIARPQGHASKWLVAGTVHLALTDVVAALVPSVAMETLHNGFAARWLRVLTLASAIARVGKTLPSSDDEDTDPSSWLSPPHSCWAFAASRTASHSVLVCDATRASGNPHCPCVALWSSAGKMMQEQCCWCGRRGAVGDLWSSWGKCSKYCVGKGPGRMCDVQSEHAQAPRANGCQFNVTGWRFILWKAKCFKWAFFFFLPS